MRGRQVAGAISAVAAFALIFWCLRLQTPRCLCDMATGKFNWGTVMSRTAAIIALAMSLAAFAVTPAFAVVGACELAKTAVEKVVCADRKLKYLDERMYSLFGRAIVMSPKAQQHEALISQQFDLQNRLEKCGSDMGCLKETYSAQINQLIDQILNTK